MKKKQLLTAYNVATKERNSPIHDAVITRAAKGAYLAQGYDNKGNKLTKLLTEENALKAIADGVAKDGFGMKKELTPTTTKKYKIVENLDDHAGYYGQPVIIAASFENDYHDVMDGNGNTWHCGIEELKEIESPTTTKGELLQDVLICENAIYRAFDFLTAMGAFTSGTNESRIVENYLIQARVRILQVKDERQKLLDENNRLYHLASSEMRKANKLEDENKKLLECLEHWMELSKAQNPASLGAKVEWQKISGKPFINAVNMTRKVLNNAKNIQP